MEELRGPDGSCLFTLRRLLSCFILFPDLRFTKSEWKVAAAAAGDEIKCSTASLIKEKKIKQRCSILVMLISRHYWYLRPPAGDGRRNACSCSTLPDAALAVEESRRHWLVGESSPSPAGVPFGEEAITSVLGSEGDSSRALSRRRTNWMASLLLTNA